MLKKIYRIFMTGLFFFLLFSFVFQIPVQKLYEGPGSMSAETDDISLAHDDTRTPFYATSVSLASTSTLANYLKIQLLNLKAKRVIDRDVTLYDEIDLTFTERKTTNLLKL